MTHSPKNCQAPNAITAISAVLGVDKVAWGSPTAFSARLNRPVYGWNRVNQMKAVATGGTTIGMMKNARTRSRPGSRTSSSSAMTRPSSMHTATKPTVKTAVTIRAWPPPVLNTAL